MSLQSPAPPVCAWRREAFAAAQGEVVAAFQLSHGLVQHLAIPEVCLHLGNGSTQGAALFLLQGSALLR